MAKRREFKVYVQGTVPEHRKLEVELMTHRLVKKLFSTRMANTLRITIKLRASTLKANVAGQACFKSLKAHTSHRSKHYIITIQRDKYNGTFLNTLVHELVHVRQFATGALRFGPKPYTNKRVYGWFWRPGSGAAEYYEQDFPYGDQPWEIEAQTIAKEITR